MKKKQIYLLIFTIIFAINGVKSQNKKYDFNGFIQYINTTWNPEDNINWMEISSVHNRFDWHWYINNKLTFYTGLRNNLDYGSLLANFYPYYINSITQDNGFLNLTHKWTGKPNYFFYSNI